MTQTSLDLNLVETIDLTMSSPIAMKNDSMVVEDEPFHVSSNAVSGSSSLVEYRSEDEEEVGYYKVELNLQSLKLFPDQLDRYQSHLLKCAEELQQAASILKAQAKHCNHTWMKLIVDWDIGCDASDLVNDVQHFEKTS